MAIKKSLGAERLREMAAEIRTKTEQLRELAKHGKHEKLQERYELLHEISGLQCEALDDGAGELLVISLLAMQRVKKQNDPGLHLFFMAFAATLDAAADGIEKPEHALTAYLDAHAEEALV